MRRNATRPGSLTSSIADVSLMLSKRWIRRSLPTFMTCWKKAMAGTRTKLEEAGFGPTVASAVDAMSRRDGEDYFAFVRRAASNPLALPVKRADLEDNVWQARQVGASTVKYEEALRILDEEFPRR